MSQRGNTIAALDAFAVQLRHLERALRRQGAPRPVVHDVLAMRRQVAAAAQDLYEGARS